MKLQVESNLRCAEDAKANLLECQEPKEEPTLLTLTSSRKSIDASDGSSIQSVPALELPAHSMVPYDETRQDPIAKELIEKLTMEVWMAPNSYIITYPICAGTMFNLVLSHHRPEKLRATELDIPIEEMREEYKDYDPRIKRIVAMIPEVVREHSQTASSNFFD